MHNSENYSTFAAKIQNTTLFCQDNTKFNFRLSLQLTKMNEFVRIQKVADAQEDSVFLWGARQVGKSTLIKKLYPNAKIYDLLKSDEYTRLLRRPQLLREELLSFGQETLVVIDETYNLLCTKSSNTVLKSLIFIRNPSILSLNNYIIYLKKDLVFLSLFVNYYDAFSLSVLISSSFTSTACTTNLSSVL